jgi:molybdenum cofactor sulfurtransferase
VGAYAQDKGALLSCADEPNIQQWLDSTADGMTNLQHETNETITYSLLAYPAKDNYEGVLYPLDWVHKVHAKSTSHHKWLVLLDAAAYVPIHTLNLTETPADFVSMSFYKVFGYPTGLGALVLRKEAADIMHKIYFGGGAVDDATAEDLWRLLSPAPARFQDGTIDFIGIAQLQYGFDLVDTLGGMRAIHQHVSALQAWTFKHLSALQHSNKRRLLEIFGKHDTPSQQSCLFQFLVHSPNGSVVPAEDVEMEAAAAGVHLRTGCHCNPGQCLKDLGIQPQEERAAALAHNTTHGFITVLRKTQEGGKTKVEPVELPIGSVRASLGALSTFEDVYALVKFLQERYVDREDVRVLRSGHERRESGLHNATVQDYWNAKCGA